MSVIRQVIGATTLALVGFGFVWGELVGRLLVTPLILIFPARRERILRAWVHAGRNFLMVTLRIVSRVHFEVQPRIPCEGGILIVANHQSLVDIPVVFSCVPDGYPRMVARARYGRGVPLVSLTMRLCGGILVQPGRTGRGALDSLAETARRSLHPIVIFPEGHRTRDGDIQPFKRAGLDAFLSARAWTVHAVVIDGLWRAAGIPGFIRRIAGARCRAESAGVFEYDGRSRATHDAFVEQVHRAMCAKLSEMRSGERPRRNQERTGEGAVKTT
jgi:1-acyl-sn-glycerol-3-phosphate acyltransferase